VGDRQQAAGTSGPVGREVSGLIIASVPRTAPCAAVGSELSIMAGVDAGRPTADVLPVGDLEIRRCVQNEYGLPERPRPAELEEIAEPWRPYRTLACMYLWQIAHTTPQLKV